MVDNSTPIMGPVTVWTVAAIGSTGALLTANAASFPWGWGWAKEPLLSATGNRFTKCPGAMGRGTFTILRDQRQEPGDRAIRAYNSTLVAGQYVCITADSVSASGAAPLDPNSVLWWGWISSLNYTQVQGTLDGIGLATALEVGHILDQQEVTDWLQASSDGLSGDLITTPPTANLGDSASYIIGNAKANVGIGDGGDRCYVFARTPTDCSMAPANLWTRWRLLRHLLYGCWPSGLPVPTLACADGSEGAAGPQDNDPTAGIAGFLNATDTPEVFDLRNLTLKGAIDLCVPRSRGFNWTLELVDTKGWQVVVYSYATVGGSGGLPVNGTNNFFEYVSPGNGTDLTADELTADVKVTSDSGTLPDEVVIEGAPIVWGNTVSFADGNLAIGWQRGVGTQEDFFRIGASGAGDYNSLTDDQKKQRNAQVRSSPGLRDVYTRYGLYSYTGGDIEVSSNPGIGSTNEFLCPQLGWDGNTLFINDDISRCPYLPAATLARTLPWPEGVKGDGTDLRPAQNKYLPTFLKPRIFGHDPADFIPWKDFEAQNGHSGYPSMSLEVDDRGMAFNLRLSSPVFLARRHWTDAAGGTTTPADDEINPDVDPNAVDFTTLLATVGVESDQRVRVKIKRAGVTGDSQVRRRLVIRDPHLQCWMMRFGAIIGLLPDGTPERITGAGAFQIINGLYGGKAVAVRNDFPAAQKRCDMAAAWAFRDRNSIRVERASPHEPPAFARIGYLITNLIEKAEDRISQAASLVVNTVVEDVTYDFTAKPRVVVTTTMPEMIGFTPIQSGTISGGSVSASLGGTVGQAVQTQQQTTSALNRDTQRVPVISPQFSPSKLDGALVVHQVAHGFSVGNAVLIYPTGAWVAATDTAFLSAFNTYTPTVGLVLAVYGNSDFLVGLQGVFSYPVSTLLPAATAYAPFYLTSSAGVTSQAIPTAAEGSVALFQTLAGNFIEIIGGVTLGEARHLWTISGIKINRTGSGLSQLTDGDVLRYVAADSLWENRQNLLSSLVDVQIASVSNGDALIYDTASTKWKNSPGFTAATHAADSVYGRAVNSAGVAADISASADNQALVRIAGTIQFAALPVAAIANVAATTVLGNATNASAAVTAIAAGADNTVMLRTGGALSFAAVPNGALANSSITITPGTGLSGGGAISLGGSATLNNTGVLSVTGGGPVTSSGGQTPTLGLAAHSIGSTELFQSTAYTVIGNPTNATANTVGITALADGQIFQRQGTSLNWATPALSTSKQTITAGGTFTVPAGVYLLFYIARGGGGGGAGASGSSVSGVTFAGGGGGQGALEIGFMAVTPAAVLTIAIGAAGSGGTASASGTAGGSTTITGGPFTVTAVGGGGATASSTTGNGGGGSGGRAAQGVSGQNGTIPNLTGATSAGGNVTGLTFSAAYPGGIIGALGSGGTGGAIGGNGNAGFVQFFY